MPPRFNWSQMTAGSPVFGRRQLPRLISYRSHGLRKNRLRGGLDLHIVDYRYTDYRLPCQNENSILCLQLLSRYSFLSPRKISTVTPSCARSLNRRAAACVSAPVPSTAPSNLCLKKNISKSLNRVTTRNSARSAVVITA